MFKKLKDKLAEEVKSSPQRIQQFAQAAQAAVTSASSSISDITNSDLFSIGDNDTQHPQSTKSQTSLNSQKKTFQEVSLVQPTHESMDYSIPTHDLLDNQRQRRLSNSSFTSDVSFRLPNYESPSMYHLQSDMEVSASEAEERGFSSGTVSLDRVTKEQLYAAYRRTQERYTKYRTQYGDLARHYKLLERENAKARSVLVETQDKALRRISELREQCSLEQSAKAHLEKALRVEIEERSMKIEALNMKVRLLQSSSDVDSNDDKTTEIMTEEDVQLINLSNDNEVKQITDSSADIFALNNKIEKMEQLLNKYKESLKMSKEKNSQLNTELQILSNEVEGKSKEIAEFKITTMQLADANEKIQELINLNEELQNKVNVYEFNKTKEQSTLEIDYQKAQEEITKLRSKIEVFSKKEEEYAISLAENKLSIHKELESKEAEIKSLKNIVDDSKKEIQSLNIVINDYKKNLSLLEAERSKLMHDNKELTSSKSLLADMEAQREDLFKKCHSLEQSLTKSEESYKCLQLQLKQETAEKLAMIDRNVYLENRNTQLCEENAKKSTQIGSLESELQTKDKALKELTDEDFKKDELLDELTEWKEKYAKLESEIQEERDELIKLQSEIEKLLTNHELLQTQNVDFRKTVADLKSENVSLQEKLNKTNKIKSISLRLANEIKDIKNLTKLVSNDAKSLQIINNQALLSVVEQLNYTFKNASQSDTNMISDIKLQNSTLQQELQSLKLKHEDLSQQFNKIHEDNNNFKATISDLEAENTIINEKCKNITNQYQNSTEQLNRLREDNENNLHKINELENNLQNVLQAVEFEKKQHSETIKTIQLLENEKQSLMNNMDIKEKESKLANEELYTLRNKYKICEDELNTNKTEAIKLMENKKQHSETIKTIQLLENENQSLMKKIDTKEEESKSACEELHALRDKYKMCEDELTTIKTETVKLLENENQSLLKNIEIKEGQNNLAHAELNALRDQYTTREQELNTMKDDNAKLLEEIKIKDAKAADMNKVKEENKAFVLENIYLKSQTESITNRYALLEKELNELRESHAEIVLEKDHLNEIIEKLETKSRKTSFATQTDTAEEPSTETHIRQEENVNNLIDNKLGHIEQCKPQHSNDNAELNKYLSLKTEYDTLKEENRRFKSDIDGLQTYLTKISKENSILNDKLRELIATSDHSIENNALSDLLELKNEFESNKDKHDDLLRENTLLIEENLELKDQLQTQKYFQPNTSTSNDNVEMSLIKEKYNNLLQVNSTLEKRLEDLEQMNKSFNGNMSQAQERNEKLRLSNEKLERRLDEALVSLRHLHSLQENTELEYLRNILYEYLTGSGMHSVTLAKVLSAIVKFDDMQTKLVLQKEKERQGILRQLGII